MTWEWLNDRMFILGWTVPLRCVFVGGVVWRCGLKCLMWLTLLRPCAWTLLHSHTHTHTDTHTHTHTHNSLMLKRKQATGGLNAYHNQTHGQCMCVCVCLSDLRCCQCWSSPPASQRSKINMFWKTALYDSPLAARKTDRFWLVP